MQSVWWFVGAAVLGIVEIFTLDLTFIMLATGLASGGVVALAGGPLWLAVVVAVVVSTAMIAALRPWLLKALRARKGPLVETNAAALVGAKGVALDDVTAKGGRIKLRGEVWTARLSEQGDPIPEGASAVVIAIEGATALVAPEKE